MPGLKAKIDQFGSQTNKMLKIIGMHKKIVSYIGIKEGVGVLLGMGSSSILVWKKELHERQPKIISQPIVQFGSQMDKRLCTIANPRTIVLEAK